jgi:hypothetical protein
MIGIPALTNGQAPAAVPPIVRQFLSRAEEPITSYRALRRLEAHNRARDMHGYLDAWTTLDPDVGFRFEIVSERGSSYIRNHVLRSVLEREADALRPPHARSAAITPDNYRFESAEARSDGLIAVTLMPRRRDALLVAGTLHLTEGDADLVRIEGRLAKPPSFWTKRVDVVRRYDRVDNVRVPVSVESTAQIRFVGASSFQMSYEYTSINGRMLAGPPPVTNAPATPAQARREARR